MKGKATFVGVSSSVIILAILLIIQTCIITYYSSLGGAASKGQSIGIMEKMEWVPEVIPREATDGVKPEQTLHYMIRKAAHFYNFFIVGILVMAICIFSVSNSCNRNNICRIIFWAVLGLSIAIFDECHQHFVPGRSAKVIDVLIDFSGVLFGMIVAETFSKIVCAKRCRE